MQAKDDGEPTQPLLVTSLLPTSQCRPLSPCGLHCRKGPRDQGRRCRACLLLPGRGGEHDGSGGGRSKGFGERIKNRGGACPPPAAVAAAAAAAAGSEALLVFAGLGQYTQTRLCQALHISRRKWKNTDQRLVTQETLASLLYTPRKLLTDPFTPDPPSQILSTLPASPGGDGRVGWV